MSGRIKYEFSANVWQYHGKGAWWFVSLPGEMAMEIRENLQWQEEGWGRLKVSAKIGHTEWKTALWYDTKMNTYLLPLKAEIRKNEKIEADDTVEVIIWI